jgi:hypothetical protein
MPFVNGYFMSRKEVEKDEKFLQGQGLSNEQASSIAIYFQQRITAKCNRTAMWIILFFFIIGAVSYHLISSFLYEQKVQQQQQDSKRLCIQNPFLPPDN